MMPHMQRCVIRWFLEGIELVSVGRVHLCSMVCRELFLVCDLEEKAVGRSVHMTHFY